MEAIYLAAMAGSTFGCLDPERLYRGYDYLMCVTESLNRQEDPIVYTLQDGDALAG